MKTKRIFGNLIFLILIVYLIYYIKENFSEFQKIAIINPGILAILVFFVIIFLLTNGLILSYILKPFKIKIKILESFALACITGFYNYIVPFRGGAIARATYLKKKYNFPFSKFISTLSAIYIISFITASLIGLISLNLTKDNQNITYWSTFFILLGIFLTLSIILLISPKLPKYKHQFINNISKIINSWNIIKKNKNALIFMSVFSIVSILITSFMFYLEFLAFGIKISIPEALLLASIGKLSSLINITPGALGIKETLLTLSSNIIGVTPIEALSVSILDRVINMAVLFAVGPIFTYYLLKNEKNTK